MYKTWKLKIRQNSESRCKSIIVSSVSRSLRSTALTHYFLLCSLQNWQVKRHHVPPQEFLKTVELKLWNLSKMTACICLSVYSALGALFKFLQAKLHVQ